jgi:aminopeptidase N
MTAGPIRIVLGPAGISRPARVPERHPAGNGRPGIIPGPFRIGRVLAALLIAGVFWIGTSGAGSAETGIQKKREALARPDAESDLILGYDALSYTAELDFPLLSRRFSGTVTLTAESLRDGLPAMAVHGAYMDIRSVEVNGVSAGWEQQGHLVVVPLLGRPSAGETFTVRIRYEAEPEYAGFFRNDTCAYTMSEPSSARYWFPCKDVPHDKATVSLSVTVPEGVFVASNGLLVDRIRSEGTETFVWETGLPISTYLICVTMSPYYARWTDRYPTVDGGTVDCLNCVFRADSAKAVEDLRNLPAAMSVFSGLFGVYPFEKYGHAEVTRDFNYGGMEHQTMTTINAAWFRGNRSREDGFVHELAHSWWGNAVTLDDWPDIWLNEGFATYCEALFHESRSGPGAYRGEIRAQADTYFDQAEKEDFPVYDPPEGELFNYGIEYCKGSLILHMLRRVVGDDAFFASLRSYYETHLYGNASRRDFQSACETGSGMNLEWFFGEWLDSAGYLSLRYDWDAVAAVSGIETDREWALSLDMAQDPSGPVFQMPLDLRAYGPGSVRADTTVWLLDRTERFRWTLPFRPDSLALDPEGWVLLKAQRGAVTMDPDGDVFRTFTLRPNYPNPFSGTTSIEVESVGGEGYGGSVVLRVYNCIGERVRSLGQVQWKSGPVQSVEWDGRDDSGRGLASGIYIVRLEGEGVSLERKVVLRR